MDLIERERELAALQQRIDAALCGSGSVVTIEGPAGIGKTSLLRAVDEVARRAGITTALARCSPIEAHLAHGVVRQLFEPMLLRSAPATDVEVRTGMAAPGTAPFASLAESVDPASAALPDALFRLTANLAARGPLLLCIDDTHVSDGPSLECLAYLVRRIEDLPVLVVAAARAPEEAVGSAFLDLVTGPAVMSLELQPLSPSGVASLMEARLGRCPDPAFALACHRASCGNPFLVRELATALDGDRIEPVGANIDRIAGLSPAVLARAIAVRLARLPGRALQLARAVAVLGDRTPLRLAAELAGLEGSVALEAADMLGDADVLEPRRAMSSQRTVSFVHPLVRATLERGTAAASQRVAHARAARLLAREGAAAGRIAGHLLHTDPEGDRARITVLRQAAHQATAEGAPQAAVTYLRRALAEGQADLSAGLLVELGNAELRAGMPDAPGTLSRAVEAAASPEELATAAGACARALLVSGHARSARTVCAEASARLAEHPELAEVLEARQLLSAHFLGSASDGLTDQLGPSPDDPEPTAAQRLLLAVAGAQEAVAGGRAERAAGYAARALGDGELLANGGPEDPALYLAIATLSLAGRSQRARHDLAQVQRAAEELGSVLGLALATTLRAWCALHAGVLGEAEADARRALQLPVPPPLWALARPVALATLIEVLLERGRDDEAESLALDDLAVDDAEESPLCDLMLVARGRVHARQRRYEKALADFEAAGRHQRRRGSTASGITTWASHAVDALLGLGRRIDANALAVDELARARDFGAQRQIGMALWCSAQAAEDDDDAVELLREAVEVLETSEARLEHARALVELGAALRRGGQRTDGRRYLRLGLEAGQACGAEVMVRRAQDEIEASGATLLRAPVADTLTASERRVAALAAEGLINREIARSLAISTSTVELHLSHTYRKLGVTSRRKLAAALATGIGAGAR